MECLSDIRRHILRSHCIEFLNYDIIGIGETHLLGSTSIDLQGFTFFGNNRKFIHRNAKHGSGGVGFLIKDNILHDFNVTVLNECEEVVLWLALKHKVDNVCICPCVYYLPPDNSSRYSDSNTFFDNKTYIRIICIYGDFNSRCSDWN